MRRLAQLIPVLVIMFAPPVMLWTLWADPVSAGEDDIGYYYPLRVMVGQALRDGRWPVQEGFEATGCPLMADPQSAVMHPATWLFAAVPAKTAYTLSIFIGFWLAGGGAYLYLRRLGLARTACTFGAVAFMFSGFFVGHRVHLGVLLTAAMLPWGLWCTEGLRRRCEEASRLPALGESAPGRSSNAIVSVGGALPDKRASYPAVLPWLAATVFLALAAGHWPTFIHLCLIWVAYFLLRARPIWRSLGVWAIGGAMAIVVAAPQIVATLELLLAATRQRIGFATAGENSFFPAAAAGAMFPFLMGNRTPNVFSQEWWGPWNQCEMFCYVGLSTLVLAGAAVWRIYRKPRGLRGGAPVLPRGTSMVTEVSTAGLEPRRADHALRPVVRIWTWIAIGAGAWMMGYYLPTYRLIHMIPVLGILRCPARMVLAVEMAAATLGAITIHVLSGGREDASEKKEKQQYSTQRRRAAEDEEDEEEEYKQVSKSLEEKEKGDTENKEKLERTVRRGATRILPIAMVGTLVLFALAALALGALGMWNRGNPFFLGGASDALEALRPWNPAVWAPLVCMCATVGVVIWWLGRPARRGAALVALLLADLFVVTRYVDAASPVRQAKLDAPPAAVWIKAQAGNGSFRVWGLSDSYCRRQRELLLPKTCCLYGVSSIAGYGPFQSPAHAHLLGFDIFGRSEAWADLLRRSRLISLYDVRYILAEEGSEYERVLAGVCAADKPASETGPNLVGADWQLSRVDMAEGLWRLVTPVLFLPSEARTPIALEPNTIYRISLDVRGPDGGAANFLRADVFHKGEDYSWFQPSDWGLTVPGDQIGTDWRHFTRTFQTGGSFPGGLGMRLYSMSERPIEVRKLAVRRLSTWESPEEPGGLRPGEAVYEKRVTLPSEEPGGRAVVIYENKLARRDVGGRWPLSDESEIENQRWNSGSLLERLFHKAIPLFPPYVGLPVSMPAEDVSRLAVITTLPGIGAYVLVVAGAVVRGKKNRARG